MRSKLIIEARRHPFLALDEEKDLLRRSGSGDSKATERLVGSHLRFVIKIAGRYRGLGPPMNDLIQDGILGLIQAVRRFDPERNVRLSTFAMFWIRAAIQDSIRRSRSLIHVNGEGPAGLSNGDSALRWGTAVDPDGVINSIVSDAPDPEEAVSTKVGHLLQRSALATALSVLPAREQLVIRRRYLEEVRATFNAIGRELGVSKDRVRQLEATALRRLRNLLGPHAIDLI